LVQEKVEFPITGKIISVNIKEGDTCEEGDILCFLESMKMENPILAPVKGKVTKINASPGQVVEAGDLAAIIEHEG
jgi:biotin carboxyl carrier protein